MKILKQIFSNLDEEKVVSKREMLLTVTTCTLAGNSAWNTGITEKADDDRKPQWLL